MSSATRKLRSSCDRCHGQKLRCIREDGVGEGGPCNRCIRQGAECRYSWCMPKGRPSVYRTTQSSSNIAPSNSQPRPTPARSASIAIPSLASSPSTAPLISSGPGSTSGESDVRTPSSGPEDSFMDASRLDPFMYEPMWWPPSQDPAMEIDAFDTDMNQWMTGMDSNNLNPLDLFPLLPAAAPTTTDLDCNTLQPQYSNDNSTYPPSSSRGSDGSSTPASLNARVNTAIAQLSQLNLRLCALHRTSSALAMVLKGRDGDDSNPIIDDAALKSVTGWLTHISGDFGFLPPVHDTHESMLFAQTTVGTTLRDTFSASQHLLEILRELRIDAIPSGDQYMHGVHQRHNSVTSDMSHHSMDGAVFMRNTIIDQLIVSCHSLLLNIFISVYNAILCDSGKWNASTSVDIRPVMVSQVCSYLIGRQNQNVDRYLSQDYPSLQPGTADTATAAFRAELSHLREEIEKRQMMLRQALRF